MGSGVWAGGKEARGKIKQVSQTEYSKKQKIKGFKFCIRVDNGYSVRCTHILC